MDCYINNGNNVYLKINEKGAIVSCGKQDAQKFSEDKAKNIIGSLPKPLQKFKFRVELIPDITPPKEEIPGIKSDELQKIMDELDDFYDDYQQDEQKYNHYTYKGKTNLEQLNFDEITDIPCFFKFLVDNLSEMPKYITNMNYLIKECDLRILDIRHYLRDPNTKLGTVNVSRIAYLLQGYERKRAEYKRNRNCVMVFSHNMDRLERPQYTKIIDKIAESEYKYRRFSKVALDEYAHGKKVELS